MNTLDIIKLIFEILVVPSTIALIGLIWKKVIKPVAKMAKGHDYMVENISHIKSELMTNGGSSIKDAINRIEKRQIMIDKRSKAVFYKVESPIFEVDEKGNLLWANKLFHDNMGTKNLKGLDWVTFIDEPQREYFLRELESCSEKLRELSFETVSTEGETIKFSGFPYRDNNRNFGFLIYLEGVKDGV